MSLYAEAMPADCPPEDAIEESLAPVYRLVASATPSEIDFASKAALGEPCPVNECPCKWRSCSLFAKAKTLRNYPRLRSEYPYLVELNIPEGQGRLVKGASRRGHVDFWRYAQTNLVSYIVNVEGPENV